MIRSLLFILIFGLTTQSFAQLSFLSDFSNVDLMSTNPAYSGFIEKNEFDLTQMEFNFKSKQQSINSNDKPVYTNFNGNLPISFGRIGLGLNFERIKTFILKQHQITTNGSYRINLGKGKLGFGLGAVFSHKSEDHSRLNIQHGTDPNLKPEQQWSFIDFNTGLLFTNDRWKLGLSILNLSSNNINLGSLTSSIISPTTYIFQCEKIISISPKFDIVPSTIFRHANSFKVVSDLFLGINYLSNNRITLGYRTNSSLIVNFIIAPGTLVKKLKSNLRIGYSYNQFSNFGFNSQTHEILLNYRIPISPKLSKNGTNHSPLPEFVN